VWIMIDRALKEQGIEPPGPMPMAAPAEPSAKPGK
jgi:hypothetical protein